MITTINKKYSFLKYNVLYIWHYSIFCLKFSVTVQMPSLITINLSVSIQAANQKTAIMIRLMLGTLLMFEALDARVSMVTKDDDIILIEETNDAQLTSFIDDDNTDNNEEPAKDIWVWGLISERYLPHVR